MEKFAKIFDLENFQVLVEKDHNKEDRPILTQTTWCSIGRFSMSGTYASDEVRDLFFDSYSEEDALSFIEDMQHFIDSPEEEDLWEGEGDPE